MARSKSLGNGLLYCAGALALMLTVSTARAGDPPRLVADRPDFTDSATAVEALHLLAEFGVTTEFNDKGQDLVFPDLLLRLGIVDYLELRVAAPLLTAAFRGANAEYDEIDIGPLMVGAKFALPVIDDVLDLGVQPELFIPLNSAHYDDTALTFGGRLVADIHFTDAIGLGFNFGAYGVHLGASDEDPEGEYLLSTSLGVDVSSNFGTFLEYYMIIDHDGDVLPVMQGGLDVKVSDGFQLDGFLGVGLNENAPAFMMGLGAAWMVL